MQKVPEEEGFLPGSAFSSPSAFYGIAPELVVETLQQRLALVQADIARLAKQPVTLVGATKSCLPQQLPLLYAAGLRCFGENKVQSLLEKQAYWAQSGQPSLEWHLIGPLQRNKINKVVGQVALIHSLDSLPLAEAISKRALSLNLTQAVLLQVNISGEPQKSGFTEEELNEVFPQLQALEGLRLCGLMGMAASQQSNVSGHKVETSTIQTSFKGLNLLKNKLEWDYKVLLQELSIGMSQDYIHALPVGATMLRLGHCLFA